MTEKIEEKERDLDRQRNIYYVFELMTQMTQEMLQNQKNLENSLKRNPTKRLYDSKN